MNYIPAYKRKMKQLISRDSAVFTLANHNEENKPRNQSELEANTCSRRHAWELKRVRPSHDIGVSIGIWLVKKVVRESSKTKANFDVTLNWKPLCL